MGIDIDAEVSKRAFDLGRSEQELDSPLLPIHGQIKGTHPV